jgi:TP901 family phage tail tape measure protein
MSNEVKIILSGDGRKLDEAINRTGKNLKTFGERTISIFTKVGRTIQHVGDRIMTPFTALVSGAGIALAGKAVIAFDARLARLAIQAGKSKKEMYALKDTLFAVSKETYQGPEELLAAMEQIVEKTGNFDLAIGALKDMGYAASASGAAMGDIGAMTSNLNQKFGITKTEMKEVFDVIIEQGKTGAFTLQHLAAMGERLFTSAASWGVKGKQGLREFGAFLQIARTGSGNEEQTTTSVERTIADMIQNRKKIQAITGLSIIDPLESKKQGRTVMKNFAFVIKEIIKRTKGDTVKLREFFNEESIRSMNAMALSYAKFGDFREFDDLVSRGGDGTQMMKDFAFWTGMSAAKVEHFRTSLLKFANDNLAGPIEAFTKALDVLNNHPIITKGGLYALLAFGGTVAGMKAFQLLQEVLRMLTGKGGGRNSTGAGGVAGMAGVQRVWVVNMNGGGMGGLPGVGGGAGKFGQIMIAGGMITLGAAVVYAFASFLSNTAKENGFGAHQRRAPIGSTEYDVRGIAGPRKLKNEIANADDIINRLRPGLDEAQRAKMASKLKDRLNADINITLEDRRTTIVTNGVDGRVSVNDPFKGLNRGRQ